MRQYKATSKIEPIGRLDAVLIRANGKKTDLGCLSTDSPPSYLRKPMNWWRSMWRRLKDSGVIPVTMGFGAFLAMYHHHVPLMFGLVTTAGVNFLASDMTAGLATPRISSMNYHDSGTGSTAAVIGNTTLETQAGPATRATGVQSNPSANVYKSVGTIAYSGTLAITEWGIFNQAAQGGTMWDHRIFSVLNVISGDSIQYSYSLTVNAGGT